METSLILLLVGGFLIVLGLALLIRTEGKKEGGVLIMIGPFPVAVGTSGRVLKALLLIALVFIVFAMVVIGLAVP
ncbi:MAG: DUF131 domain-containing protein [Candidatus Methanosuratus sp.]|nr:DUF131 domain-containing protein [Candidatus Methanosuratincola sp.]